VGEEEAAKQVQLVEQVVSQQEAPVQEQLEEAHRAQEEQAAIKDLFTQALMAPKIIQRVLAADIMVVVPAVKIITAVAVHLFTQT